jgi:hypothetical protein
MTNAKTPVMKAPTKTESLANPVFLIAKAVPVPPAVIYVKTHPKVFTKALV